MSTALALGALFAFERVMAGAFVAGAMTIDACLGSDTPFDARIQAQRRHQGPLPGALQAWATLSAGRRRYARRRGLLSGSGSRCTSGGHKDTPSRPSRELELEPQDRAGPTRLNTQRVLDKSIVDQGPGIPLWNAQLSLIVQVPQRWEALSSAYRTAIASISTFNPKCNGPVGTTALAGRDVPAHSA